MPVLALGISYRRAPVELLERLAFAGEDLPKAYRQLGELESVQGAVLLSTCNRVEVYAEVSSYHAGFLDLKRFLSESREVPLDDIAEPLYSHYEDDAAEHLFAVASGLDSMVVGEPQIQTQVRQAYRAAEDEGAPSALLIKLFGSALRTGRRVRERTGIGASPSAMVDAALELARGAVGPLEDRSALVVGAGGIAALAVKDLRARGVARLTVLNRNPDRARRLADRLGAESDGLEGLPRGLAEADLVVSSTAASGLVIGLDVARRALAGRGREPSGRPVVFVDLAVPRDVDPRIAEEPNAVLIDIDDVKLAVAGTGADQSGEMDRARAIVAEEVRRLAEWRRAAKLAPLIQALRDRGARIQATELARVAPRLSSLSDREWADVQAMAGAIVAKLLHEPIVGLKARAATGSDSLTRAAAELFGLDPDDPAAPASGPGRE
jgi:glutamyl-tRNA reductase